MEKSQAPVSSLPFHFHAIEEEKYGAIRYTELICPGVYHIAAQLPGRRVAGEYIVATADSPAISPAARAFCTPLLDNAVLCEEEYGSKGSHVLKYEAYKYLEEHNLPLPEGCSAAEARIWGMEVCPEYFGEFPIPTQTPWGETIRHDRLWNGLYWLNTGQAGWVLAIAYPLGSGLSETAEALASLMEYDQEHGIDHTFGYRFYPYEASCIPLFELLEFETDTWEEKINTAALKNAILEFFPAYAREFAEHAEEGLLSCGEISETPGAGVSFYRFP